MIKFVFFLLYADTMDNATNTNPSQDQVFENEVVLNATAVDQLSPPQAAPRRAIPAVVTVLSNNTGDLSLTSQLKQAMYLASTRSALLLEHENRLAVAHARVKTLEKIIEERGKSDFPKLDSQQSPRNDDDVLSVTIASLQNMMQEKEANLIKYQEMVRVERQNVVSANEMQRNELKQLKATIDELRNEIRLKEQESENTKGVTLITKDLGNQLMPDTFVEELFLEDRTDPYSVFNSAAEMIQLQQKIQDAEDEIRQLHGRLREVSLRESGWERTMCEKDKEIEELKNR